MKNRLWFRRLYDSVVFIYTITKPLSFMYMKQVVCCSFEQHSSHPYLYFQVSFKGNQPTDVQSELETTATDVQSELETTFNGKEK